MSTTPTDPLPSSAAEFDVFISHATPDDAIVTRIAERITAVGIRSWVDHERGISYGDNWDRAIHDAANTCRYGLFVLSPRSAKSEYCIAEWNRILALGKRLYIALIDPVPLTDIPLRLATLQYADLTRDFDGALNALIAAIQAERGLDPSLTTTGQALRLTGPFPRWQLDLPILGREDDLKAARDLLAANYRAVVVLGLGGVGKTRLAAEIAATEDTARFRDGVIWHEIADYTTLATLTGLIREHFGLTEKANDDQVWQELDRRAALLVLDNAESCKDPASYAARLGRLDLSGGTRVLITNRAEWRDLRNQKRHDLHHPAPEAARAIFEKMLEAEPPTFSPNGQASALVKAARYHPRLMQYTVRWLNDFPPPAVLNTLTTLRGADAEEALDDMVLKTVAQVRTKLGGEAAIAALRQLAVCRGGLSYEAALALVGPEATPVALKLLKQWGLITAEGERYDIDPLVAVAVGEDEAAFVAHYDYYKTLARQHKKKQDYLGLDPESANLEIAFERALEHDPEAAYWLANACYGFLQNRGRTRQFMAWLKRDETSLAGRAGERLSAALSISLGNAYRDLAGVEEREANLRRAIAAYQEALRYYTPDAVPFNYGRTQFNLGNAYRDLAGLEEREANLRRAIAAYQEALRYVTPDVAPLAYARTQFNLGNAYRSLAKVEEREANLRRAIAAYQEALRCATPEAAPLDYAATQNNLGLAYRGLAKVEEREANLRRAIAAYQEALRCATPEAAPFDYAATQFNLGNAYRDLAGVEEREANLRRAIAAYQQVLRFRTPEAAPLDYAMTQNNLGLAYRDLAGVGEREANLRRAIAAYQEALRYVTPEVAPLDNAVTQFNLGVAYSDLAGVEEREANLRRAIAPYQEALRYYTPEVAPFNYAVTQASLGVALEKSGDLSSAVACWRAAEPYYRQMGDVIWADRMLKWITDGEQRLAAEQDNGSAPEA